MLTKKINKLKEQEENILNKLKLKIDSFPQNKKIKNISEDNKTLKIFTINFSDLNKNNSLRPEDYDYKFLYSRIYEELVININTLIDKLNNIIKNKKVVTGSQIYYLPDEIIYNLKKLI